MKKLLILITLIIGKVFAGSFTLENNTSKSGVIEISPVYKNQAGEHVHIEKRSTLTLKPKKHHVVQAKRMKDATINEFQLIINCGQGMYNYLYLAAINSTIIITEKHPGIFSVSTQ